MGVGPWELLDPPCLHTGRALSLWWTLFDTDRGPLARYTTLFTHGRGLENGYVFPDIQQPMGRGPSFDRGAGIPLIWPTYRRESDDGGGPPFTNTWEAVPWLEMTSLGLANAVGQLALYVAVLPPPM